MFEILVEPTEKDIALLSALRAEATRLGVDWHHASDADVARLARVIPEGFRSELMAVGIKSGWDPDAFIVFVLRPLFEDGEHDCAACEKRVTEGKRRARRGQG
jgi:hypothetical protein